MSMSHVFQIFRENLEYRFRIIGHHFTAERHSIHIVLVNGSPKSGTTWMLRLVTSLPGYSRVPETNFGNEIGRLERICRGQVAHGHHPYTPALRRILEAKGFKVVLMVRDPRDQAVSRMFHAMRDPAHTQHRQLNRLSIDEALMASIEGLPGLRGVREAHALTKSWLEHRDLRLVIRYEDLLNDSIGQFSKVLEYLALTLRPSLQKAVVSRNRFQRLSIGRRFWKSPRSPGQEDAQSHFRKGICGDWRNYFTDRHIKRFQELAGDALIELGYESSDDWQ